MGHDFAVSPLRLVAAYGALASKGEPVNARLRPSAPRTTSRFVSAASAQQVATMLEGVVSPEGTGKLAAVERLRVAVRCGDEGRQRRRDRRPALRVPRHARLPVMQDIST